MSFVETERTAMDAELARQTLLRLQFEDEARRQADVKIRIEEEAARAADKAVREHLYETSQQEIDLNNKLVELYKKWESIKYCGGSTTACGIGQYKAWQNFSRCLRDNKGNTQVCNSHYPTLEEIEVVKSALSDLQEKKREEFRLQFITTATEREEALRVQETNAALETLRLAEEAQERERLRIIQEEAEQREIELQEYTVRMAALQAEQQESLRLAELNRQIGLDAVKSVEGDKAFKVELPQPIMTSMSIPTPMLLIGGAVLLLLAGRRK